MNLLFWRNSGPSKLSWDVRNYLRTNYQITQEALENWRTVRKNSKFGGRKVRLVRIFDPATTNGTPVNVYDDLKDMNGVMFTLQIEKNGEFYAVDKRA